MGEFFGPYDDEIVENSKLIAVWNTLHYTVDIIYILYQDENT
jgi:hypothetical protein